MASIVTTKTFKAGAVRKDEGGQFIFEEFGKDESKFYNITELLESLVDEEGTSMTYKTGQELPSDADQV